ncbi:MAG: hypothetical protein M1828_001106 [Chrysothrix sp. TS-e1954]|nr:MAG: hypothetical protein M1828_001106 [Chrysothrix sp. TS-e1954]
MAPIALSPTTETHSPFEQKSSLKRKHDSSQQSGPNSDDSRASASKKLRVAFDEDVEVRMVDELGERPVNLIREEIRTAIQQLHAGDREEYDKLKKLLSKATLPEQGLSRTLLRKYILGLISNVTLLTKSCGDLVEVVLEMKWLGLDDVVVDLYVKFMAHLVSSQSGNIGRVLAMLVGNLASNFASAGELADGQRLGARNLRARVHATLKYILQLVPSASALLSKILYQRFPFPTDSVKCHTRYVRNILSIGDYAPELKSDILNLIMERLVKIDVQIQVDLEDLEEEAAEDAVPSAPKATQDAQRPDVNDASDLESESDGASDVDSVLSDDELDAEEQRLAAIRASVQKVDSILHILFKYYESAFSKPSSHDSRALFSVLLAQCWRTVLPAYRSRFAQFVVFRYAQHSPDFTDRFVDTCLKVLTEKTCPSTVRMSAAAYLGSFTARAATLSPSAVLTIFESIASYAEKQRKELAPTCRDPGAHRYTVYYATIQALLYIFCFRWRDLLSSSSSSPSSSEQEPSIHDLDDEDLALDLENHGSLPWSPGVRPFFSAHLIGNNLNPLKVCAPEIVNEFARISCHLRFMYVYQVLEANKRVRRVGNGMEAVFPFDPCRLPRSRRWIEGVFNQWRGVPGLDRVAQDVDEVPESEEEDASQAGAGAAEEDEVGEEEQEEEGTTPEEHE